MQVSPDDFPHLLIINTLTHIHTHLLWLIQNAYFSFCRGKPKEKAFRESAVVCYISVIFSIMDWVSCTHSLICINSACADPDSISRNASWCSVKSGQHETFWDQVQQCHHRYPGGLWLQHIKLSPSLLPLIRNEPSGASTLEGTKYPSDALLYSHIVLITGRHTPRSLPQASLSAGARCWRT